MALKKDDFSGLGKTGELVQMYWVGNQRVRERHKVSQSQA